MRKSAGEYFAGAVTLREATRTVGVSPNAAYRHFADRDDLLSAVAWEATGMLAARMQRDLDAVPGRTGTMTWAGARLSAVGHAYLGFAHDEPGLFRTAFSAPGGRTPHEGTHRQAATPREPPCRSSTTPSMTSSPPAPSLGHAGPTPPPLAWATVHGLATLRLAGTLGDHDRHVLDDALDQFIQRGL